MARIVERVLAGAIAAVAVAGGGCTALAVGGAAAGGYYIGKDERPAAQIAEDAAITGTVKTRLVGDKYVDAFDVNVDTYDGVVTLRGKVDSYVARSQAEQLALGVKGVKSVVNQLEVVVPQP